VECSLPARIVNSNEENGQDIHKQLSQDSLDSFETVLLATGALWTTCSADLADFRQNDCTVPFKVCESDFPAICSSTNDDY